VPNIVADETKDETVTAKTAFYGRRARARRARASDVDVSGVSETVKQLL